MAEQEDDIARPNDTKREHELPMPAAKRLATDGDVDAESEFCDTNPLDEVLKMWHWMLNIHEHNRMESAMHFRCLWGYPHSLCKADPDVRSLFSATSLLAGPRTGLAFDWMLIMIDATRAFTFCELVALACTSRHFRTACLSPLVWRRLAERDFHMKFAECDVITPARYYSLACSRLRSALKACEYFNGERRRFYAFGGFVRDLFCGRELQFNDIDICAPGLINWSGVDTRGKFGPFECVHRTPFTPYEDERFSSIRLWLRLGPDCPVVEVNLIDAELVRHCDASINSLYINTINLLEGEIVFSFWDESRNNATIICGLSHNVWRRAGFSHKPGLLCRTTSSDADMDTPEKKVLRNLINKQFTLNMPTTFAQFAVLFDRVRHFLALGFVPDPGCEQTCRFVAWASKCPRLPQW